MRRFLTFAAGLLVAASLLAGEVTRVEPLSWWTGMKTDLQLLVQGPGIGAYAVSVEGKGLKIKEVHKADNPNFLFVDVEVSPKAKPGTYTLVFKNGNDVVRYPYEIAARKPGSADRESFTTSDLIYLIVPDRFANGDPSNDSVDTTWTISPTWVRRPCGARRCWATTPPAAPTTATPARTTTISTRATVPTSCTGRWSRRPMRRASKSSWTW